MVLGRRSLPICRVSRAPSETPDCPNVWTPTWKGLGGDPFVGGWFMNHPVFLPMTDPCILVYLPTFGFNSHHCNKGKKVGEVTHVFLQTQGKKYIYIYIHTAYIYIYILYTGLQGTHSRHSYERRNVKVMKVWYKEWKIKQEPILDTRGP